MACLVDLEHEHVCIYKIMEVNSQWLWNRIFFLRIFTVHIDIDLQCSKMKRDCNKTQKLNYIPQKKCYFFGEYLRLDTKIHFVIWLY